MKRVISQMNDAVVSVEDVSRISALAMIYRGERFVLACDKHGAYTPIMWGTYFPEIGRLTARTLEEWLIYEGVQVFLFESMDELARWLVR